MHAEARINNTHARATHVLRAGPDAGSWQVSAPAMALGIDGPDGMQSQ